MDDTHTYHIELHGRADANELNATSPIQMRLERIEAETSLFSARTDQSGLIGLLRHLHGRGLALLAVYRCDALSNATKDAIQ